MSTVIRSESTEKNQDNLSSSSLKKKTYYAAQNLEAVLIKKRRNLAGLQNSVSSSSIPSVTSLSQGHQTVSEGDDEVLIARSQESHRLPEHNEKDKVSSEADGDRSYLQTR